jgi:hypothetical protein
MTYNLIIIKVMLRIIMIKFKCIAKQKRIYSAVLALLVLNLAASPLSLRYSRDAETDLLSKAEASPVIALSTIGAANGRLN